MNMSKKVKPRQESFKQKKFQNKVSLEGLNRKRVANMGGKVTFMTKKVRNIT